MTKKPFETLGGSLSDVMKSLNTTNSLNKMNEVMGLIQTPNIEIPRIPDHFNNPAKWTYMRLGEYIKDFENDLDNEHEIGARLVSFGQAIIFHIESVGYHGPDIINFDGINEKGERVQLIQNISQLSVLLVAMKKLKDKPRRIGFIWDDEGKEGKDT